MTITFIHLLLNQDKLFYMSTFILSIPLLATSSLTVEMEKLAHGTVSIKQEVNDKPINEHLFLGTSSRKQLTKSW